MKIKILPNPELLQEIKSNIPDAVEVIIPFWGDDTCFDIGSDFDSIEAYDNNGDDIDLDDEEINYHIIATTCLCSDMNDINYMKSELKSQDKSDEEVDEILKSFPKDYFVEGGEDMIESFSMIDN